MVAATFKTGLSPLPNASTSEEPYEVEIWDVLNRTKRASFHGRSESRSRNLSLAVDDAGLNIFVWPRDSPFDEFTHPFDQASGVYQSYAPRELPRFLQFDVAVLSGDGKRLLLATKNGFVEVWECEHARRKFCRLSLNLKQFGLLRISEYLPRFDLDHAFDFEISQFNAYSLLSVLDHLQNPFRAAFLIAKPSDSKKLFDESALRREWERDADVARASGNAKISVALLDRCIHHESADQERIVEKRQAIAFACARRTLAEVRQISEEEQYWELPLSAICSPAPGEFDVLTRGVYQESGAKASIRRCFFPPSQGVKGWQRDQRDFYVNEKDASCDPLLSLPAGVGLFRVNYYVRDKFKLVAALNAKSAESLWELPLRKHFSLDQVCFAAGSVWALLDTNRLSQLDAESGRVTASFEFREPIARIEKFVTDQAAEMLFLSPESASRCYFLNPKTSEMREHALGFPNGWEVMHLPQSSAVIGRSPMFGIVYFRSLLPDGGERDWTWKSPREDVSFVKPTACGRAIAFMTPCKFQIWDIETSRSVFEWGIHDLKDYAFDASGRWLLMAASLHRLERFELFWNPS